MSLRSNGSYIGPRPTGPSSSVASGIWDLRTVQRQRSLNQWTGQPIPDPNFADVSLLLHMDGSGSTFVDFSGSPKTVTANGNATQSTTESKFGGKSAYFDGSGDYLSISSNSAFGFGTGDFTVEYWHFPIENVADETVIDFRISNGGVESGKMFLMGKSSAGAVRTYDGSSVRTGGSMTLNAWNHVAWVRSGGTNTVYLDGASVISFSNGADMGASRPVTIGALVDPTQEPTKGYIDDLRITKGVARTITVPTAAYPDQ